ncbi:MAG: inositol monophosphatase [Myxococcales bacterium]|nr:inositol monophosphatase [Myxococcales bacterium]MCB9569670.1 inositol monophosphatase [Myxococcales bacterium]MCB9700477.1 inositol monophosphatase [Myxococcales bacterium]
MPILLSLAIEIAREAGALLLGHLGGELEISTKSSPVDLVTNADRAAEALIVARIRARFPDHAILGEEGGEQGASDAAAIRWIIDPLDGTTNFAHQIPHFAVSIGIHDREGALVGVVHDPARGETFFARRGGGAFVESARGPHRGLAVTPTAALGDALLGTGFAYQRSKDALRSLAELSGLLPEIRGIRRMGSAALDLAYVAAGRLDGYWERDLSPWDTAAGALLVQEAGGTLRQIGGDAWTPWDRSVVAAGPALMPTLLAGLAAAGEDPGQRA